MEPWFIENQAFNVVSNYELVLFAANMVSQGSRDEDEEDSDWACDLTSQSTTDLTMMAEQLANEQIIGHTDLRLQESEKPDVVLEPDEG